MLKGVSWGTQNFRWILRLVCDLGALHSAHTVASPSAEKGEAGLQSSWCQLSYHTYLWDVDTHSGPHGPAVTVHEPTSTPRSLRLRA